MRRSRAGRTGGSWYGSYEVWIFKNDERVMRVDSTNFERAKQSVRAYVKAGLGTRGQVRTPSTLQPPHTVLYRFPKGAA